jgi:hypothetical protein
VHAKLQGPCFKKTCLYVKLIPTPLLGKLTRRRKKIQGSPL